MCMCYLDSVPTCLAQPEFLSHSLAQPPDPLIYLLRRRRRISRPEKQRIVSFLVIRVEPAAAHDQRPMVNNLEEDLLLNRLDALGRIIRMFPEIDLHPVE